MKTAVRDQVNKMDAVEYFTLLAELLKTNPPSEADAPMVEKLAEIGIVPGQDFDKTKFDPAFAKRVPADRLRPHHAAFQVQRRRRAGYRRLGLHNQDGPLRHQLYPARAVTAIGLGANRPQDAIYPTSMKAEQRPDQASLQRFGKIRPDLQEGPDSAGFRFLVADDV